MIYIKSNLKKVKKINNSLYFNFKLSIHKLVNTKKFMNISLMEVQ